MYIDLLAESAKANNSIACVGLDPVLEKIPVQGKDAEAKIARFYSGMIDAMVSERTLPGAFKPNYAFYAQYGFPGLRALETVIARCRAAKVLVVFDGKRGDIGKTSAAYAKEAFEFWGADCVTVAPYMGSDSVMPFIKFCEEKGKGVYILNRTSNEGAKDLQNLDVRGKPLFISVAEKIVEWGANAKGNVGAVVGATSTAELKEIAALYAKQKNPVPLLIPGVGAQGGSASEVVQILRGAGLKLAQQRINSSGAINYAYEAQKTDDYAGAAVKALKELNKEIGFK